MALTESDARILRGAEAAIERFGLRRFTMGDVADASGVRRQAIYEQIGTRDDLVRAILEDKAQRLHDRTARVIARESAFADKLIEGLLFVVEDSLAEPYMRGLMGEGDFATLSTIVGADRVMPDLAGQIWRPVLDAALRSGELVPGHRAQDIERWLTYVMLMLVGARAQGISDVDSDRRLLTRMLLPALVLTTP